MKTLIIAVGLIFIAFALCVLMWDAFSEIVFEISEVYKEIKEKKEK